MNQLITAIPPGVKRALRQTMMNRPNVYDCDVWRLVPTRTTDETHGDLPTVGGMGMASAEDEVDTDPLEIGPGKIFFCDPFQPTPLTNDGSGLSGGADAPQLMTAIVLSVAEEGDDGYFEAQRRDIVLLKFDNMVISYQIMDILSTTGIPSFTQKFLIAKTDDLKHFTQEFTDAQEVE